MYIRTYVYIYVYIQIYIYTHIYIYIYIHTHTHTRSHTHIHSLTHTLTHPHTHTHIYTPKHMNKYTQTPQQQRGFIGPHRWTRSIVHWQPRFGTCIGTWIGLFGTPLVESRVRQHSFANICFPFFDRFLILG